jgi:hypothetical protein
VTVRSADPIAATATRRVPNRNTLPRLIMPVRASTVAIKTKLWCVGPAK